MRAPAGWVAYSINALVSGMGENKLMPGPDCKCLVINGETGYTRDNTSWIFGRLVRDYEQWMDESVRNKVEGMLQERWDKLKKDAIASNQPEPARPTQTGLCVSIYRSGQSRLIGKSADNFLYIVSSLVAIIQLGVAAIPLGIFGDWGIFMITGAGIILSSVTASFPQWKQEKWACRRLNGNEKKFILTRGNGSQHAIVILGCEDFLDLEDLGAGQTNVNVSASTSTRIAVVVLACLWVLLLVTAAGLKANTWFLLSVGAIGIFFNIYVAGHRRHPQENGLPIEFVQVIGETRVMPTLYEVE